MRYRSVLAALVTALAFAAAGCGGDDNGGGGAEEARTSRGRLDDGDLGRRGAGVVPGRDRRLRGGLSERERQVHVGGRQPCAAALDGGRGRQPAGRSPRSASRA